MAGYPTIPTRNAFGPVRKDDGIAPDNEKYVGSYHFNLLFHQVAGMGVLAPRAYVILTFASGVATIAEHGESWAPNGDGLAPTLALVSAGEWTLQYASGYTNQVGGMVQTVLRFAGRSRQSPNADDYVEAYVAADSRTVHVLNYARSSDALVAPDDATSIVVFAF